MALLSLRGVALSFGGPKLFDGLDLMIEAGERVCLLGRNGEGKSTLLKLITGEIDPDEGTVVRQQGLRIARLPQDQAEAVVLRVVMGLDAKTAADTLGKRPGAVRTAAHRGLKKLAELLGDDPETAGVLDALPPQQGPRSRAVPSAGVTHVRTRTQRDM